MRIGIYGGSFDPVHVAHLSVAEQAREELALDKVLFMPAWQAPHKQSPEDQASACSQDRIAMLRIALEDHPAFEISALEIERKGTSFTVDTLETLATQIGFEDSLFLLIGSDNYNIFDHWYRPDRILELCKIGVYERPGAIIESLAPGFFLLKGPKIDLSSSWIRDQISIDKSVKFLVPEKVRQYIYAHHLYGS